MNKAVLSVLLIAYICPFPLVNAASAGESYKHEFSMPDPESADVNVGAIPTVYFKSNLFKKRLFQLVDDQLTGGTLDGWIKAAGKIDKVQVDESFGKELTIKHGMAYAYVKHNIYWEPALYRRDRLKEVKEILIKKILEDSFFVQEHALLSMDTHGWHEILLNSGEEEFKQCDLSDLVLLERVTAGCRIELAKAFFE